LESVNNEYTYWCIDNICFEEKVTTPILDYHGDLEIIWPVLPHYPANRVMSLVNSGMGEIEVSAVDIVGDQVFSWLNSVSLPFSLNGSKQPDSPLCQLSLVLNIGFAPLESASYHAILRMTTSVGVLEFPLNGQGRSCDQAVPVEIGENWSPTQNTIYSYTAVVDELVTVSSCDPRNTVSPYQYSYDSFLGIFGSCDINNKIAENDDVEWEGCEFNRASSGATVMVRQGQTIYITWPFMYHNPLHAWDGFYFHVQSTPSTIPIDLGLNQTAYIGYEPLSCVTISPIIDGGVPPYSYQWSTGETTETITICPDNLPGSKALYEYSLIVIDSNGEVGIAFGTINIVDVRCGDDNDKVLMCKKTGKGTKQKHHTICVSPNAVPAQLATGATLGPCGDGAPVRDILTDLDFQIYPNPNFGEFRIQGTIDHDEKTSIRLLNVLGQIVYDENIAIPVGNFVHNIKLLDAMPGNYFITIRNGDNFYRQSLMIE